jgi:tetratricopeptide (TPR) repeat protein
VKKLNLLLLLIFLSGCSQQSYKDITSSASDIQLYNLKEINLTDDNGTKITLHIPNDLKNYSKDNTISAKTLKIAMFESYNENFDEGFNISIDKLYSKYTEEVSDKEYIEIAEKGFKQNYNGDFSFIIRGLPPAYEDVKVYSLDFDLMIDGKFFGRRVLYCKDKRLKGTSLYDSQIIEYQYITLHNKRKYQFTIRSYSNIQSISSLVALMNTIAGSIKFQENNAELDPNNANAYYKRGNSKFDLKDYNGAIADYTKAIELDPNNANAYYKRGVSKAYFKDYDNACKDVKKAQSMGYDDFFNLYKSCD